MKNKTIEYVVFHYGREVGRRYAVSEKQAINSYRYSTLGICGMSKDCIDYYEAIPAITLKMKSIYEENKKQEFEQMRLQL